MNPPGVPFHGIVPPMITPLIDGDTLDTAGLERLVGHLLTGGVHGLFILGTSGEGPHLGYRLRRELIERTCRLVGGRVPILVGITDTSMVESLALARHAADAGAQAVVTAGPYYFPIAQPELIRYIEQLARELPLPVLLYNMPQMTKVTFEPQTLRQVSHLARIVGVKDSSGDLAYFDQLLEAALGRPDWSLLVGPEDLIVPAVRRGGHGGVPGAANVWPQLLVQLYEAARTRDEPTLARLERQLATLRKIYRVGAHASAVVKGMKCAASLRGICRDVMAEPFAPFEAEDREKVQAVLDVLGLVPV